MGSQRGSFQPNQGKHDPVMARILGPGEAVTSSGFGALLMPMMQPMKGKVYVTTHRVAIVFDGSAAGPAWAVPWGEITAVDVKKSLMAATAVLTTGDDQWGVDSTKAIVRDLEAAWRIANAR
jgi:hypothetical protein